MWNMKNIAVNYLRGYFFIDILSVLPVTIIENQENVDTRANRYLKIARLQRLYRISRVIKILKMYQFSFYLGFARFKMPRSTLRILNLVTKVMLSVHFVACIWNLSGKLYDFAPNTWIYQK
jgi:hypothetical protein